MYIKNNNNMDFKLSKIIRWIKVYRWTLARKRRQQLKTKKKFKGLKLNLK